MLAKNNLTRMQFIKVLPACLSITLNAIMTMEISSRQGSRNQQNNFALTLLLSLIAVFEDLQSQSEICFKNSHAFGELNELAKRFALTFGFDAIKNLEPIIALQRAGILFAVGDVPEDPVAAPNHLLFFKVLTEFIHKLLKKDNKVIFNFFDRRISPGMPSSKPEEYQPLTLYRTSLLHGETDQAAVSSKRSYARKRHDHEDDEEDYEEKHNDPVRIS